MCECKCDKLGDVGEYLDCVNCICRKRLIDRLILGREAEILIATEALFDDKKSDM